MAAPSAPRPASPTTTWIMLMEDPCGPHRSIAEIARERGVDPVEAMIEVALERDLEAFFVQPLFNENLDHVLEMMKHPHSVVTFSDSGAHVSQIMDSSLQTQVLAYWVRRRQALTLEEGVRMLTLRAGVGLGPPRPRAAPRGAGRRRDRLRSRPRGARHARGGERPARRRPAPAPEGHRLRRVDRERPGGAARRRAHRGVSRPRPPGTPRHGGGPVTAADPPCRNQARR